MENKTEKKRRLNRERQQRWRARQSEETLNRIRERNATALRQQRAQETSQHSQARCVAALVSQQCSMESLKCSSDLIKNYQGKVMNPGECGETRVSTRIMNHSDPDVPAVKSEPRSPAESGDEDDGETCFSDANIKVEIFPDLPIEFEPRTDAQEVSQNCTNIYIKQENDTTCSNMEDNLVSPHSGADKHELSPPAECYQEEFDMVDISDTDIKYECLEHSRNIQRTGIFSKKEDPASKKSPGAPSTLGNENLRSNLPNAHKPFSCGQCSYTCNRRGNLRKHLLTHTEEKPFVCTHCPYACNLKEYLKRHMLTHTGNKLFSCSHCMYSCYRKEHLRRHMLTHTGAKPFACSYCDYTCNQKALLRTHVTTHTGDKSFSCTRCNYTGVSKGSLKSHMLIHSGNKSFICPHCPYSCKRQGHLSRHMLTHTGVKPFSCSHCSYTCKRKGDLSRHLLTHTGEKPFSCSNCSYKCNQKGNLRSHTLTHTAEQQTSS